jgi:hypothetical protein
VNPGENVRIVLPPVSRSTAVGDPGLNASFILFTPALMPVVLLDEPMESRNNPGPVANTTA